MPCYAGLHVRRRTAGRVNFCNFRQLARSRRFCALVPTCQSLPWRAGARTAGCRFETVRKGSVVVLDGWVVAVRRRSCGVLRHCDDGPIPSPLGQPTVCNEGSTTSLIIACSGARTMRGTNSASLASRCRRTDLLGRCGLPDPSFVKLLRANWCTRYLCLTPRGLTLPLWDYVELSATILCRARDVPIFSGICFGVRLVVLAAGFVGADERCLAGCCSCTGLHMYYFKLLAYRIVGTPLVLCLCSRLAVKAARLLRLLECSCMHAVTPSVGDTDRCW